MMAALIPEKSRWMLWLLALPALPGVRWLIVHHETGIRSLSPGCFFHRYTGLYCPGCGGTRAFFAFLKGDFATSLRMNPLFLGGIALGGMFAILALVDRKWGRPRWLAWVQISGRTGWCLLGLCISFGILRNIPRWPFTLLAPY